MARYLSVVLSVLFFITVLCIFMVRNNNYVREAKTVMILDGLSCEVGDEGETSKFISSRRCVVECGLRGVQVCVVNMGKVYYRSCKIGTCLWNLKPHATSSVYLCSPWKLPYLYDIDTRVQLYCQGILAPIRRSDLHLNYTKLVQYLTDHESKEWTYRHHQLLRQFMDKSGARYKFNLNPYDICWSLESPTFTKSRNLEFPGNSVLLPLEQLYQPSWHVNILADEIEFSKKLDNCVWRGVNSGAFYEPRAGRASRRDLVLQYAPRSDYNIGLSHHNSEPPPGEEGVVRGREYVKGPLTVGEQLAYRYIISVEGNDFATNLGWIMLSNSVPLMPRPSVETWKMERHLVPYVHYVPLQADFSDLDRQMAWCRSHQRRCKKIALLSKIYILQFFQKSKEDEIINRVIKTYGKNVISD
jgi:hypothetical protein